MPIIKAKRLRVLGDDGKWHDIPAVDNTSSAVKYIPQELTDEQKAQARENIGALPDTTEIPPQYTLPQATSDALGGIKADALSSFLTEQVKPSEFLSLQKARRQTRLRLRTRRLCELAQTADYTQLLRPAEAAAAEESQLSPKRTRGEC